MAKIEAYLFDMDGLLLDTERVFLSVGAPLLVEAGLSRTEAEAFFMSLVGSSGAHTTQRLADVAGGTAAGAALEARWRKAFHAQLEEGVPLRPTVQDTLAGLSLRGARMAVVTSTHGTPARHHLEQAGLLDYFEHVRGGDEVSANKPNPAPYLEMAAALGVDPTRCAAFEDSDRGATAAVRAGCLTTQIPDLRPADTPLPDIGQRVALTLADAVAALEPIGNDLSLARDGHLAR